jgi:FkbM family methyltransferase
VAEHNREAAVMKIAWFTPYRQNSSIGKFSSLVAGALAARDHSITLISSEEHPLTEHLHPPAGIELLHWSLFESDPAAADVYDVIVYNIENKLPSNFGVLRLIDRYSGVCIFHDFYLVDLFVGWYANEVERPLAHSIVSSIYGEMIAKDFWNRIGNPEFQPWLGSHAPMTEWLARKALATVGHAPFYEHRLAESSAGPVRVIPPAYKASSHDSPQIQMEGGRVRILTVGRVNPNKRVEVVVNAIAASPVLRTRCEYNIVGDIDAPERVRLLSLIERLGLSDVVHLRGAVSDFELRWRYAEADIVSCLRWPSLEGASASCIEAMSYGKAVIVTDTGFYSSIPPDRVVKVKPSYESEDLTRHLEMLVVDAGKRDSLGKRAKEWAQFEYAPDPYAARIEPLLEAAVEGKPLIDALRQIGVKLRATGAEPDEPIVERVGSDFRSLFCGSESRIDPIKCISNMLGEPASPSGGEQRRSELQPDLGDDTAGASSGSPSASEGRRSELQPDSEDPVGAPLRSASASEQRAGELPPDSRNGPGGARLRRWVLSFTDPILSRFRHFLFRCAEPILWHLRGYFLGDLLNLTKSVNQRVFEVEQSVGALRQQADEIRRRNERLARRGDIAVFADRLSQLESQFGNAQRLIGLLVNRNSLVLGDELVARTPYGYLLAPTDDLDLACILVEGASWEPATSRLLDLTLKEGMTFVDVGAHVGVHTLHGASRVAPNGTVIAFEPTPKLFQLLQRAVHLNGIDDVCRCINIALSSSEGLATFHLSGRYGHNSLYRLGNEEEKSKMQVRTASFDSVLHEAQRIDVVKIDVEGAELDVLEGMRQILAKHEDILLIVEYGIPHLQRLEISPSKWFDRFFAHGFALFALDEQAGTWRHVAEEEASQLPSTNVAFVRPETRYWTVLKKHEA